MPARFLVTGAEEFQKAAFDELAERYDSNLKTGQTLAPGLFFVSTGMSEEYFASLVAENPPIFSRHMFPVQAAVELDRTRADLDKLATATSELFFLEKLGHDAQFAVQARLIGEEDGNLGIFEYTPFAIKEKLAAILQEKSGGSENIRNPQFVLSVVCSPDRAFLGLSPVEWNISSWAGGMRRLAKPKDQISRAEFKLEEALEVFEVALPNKGRALDLGAAPGGWTRLLLEAGLLVTAVDPAALDPGLKKYGSRLTHVHGLAQNFLEKALLDSSKKQMRFNLIVSDLRMDAEVAATLLVEFEPLLTDDGFIITTLKLPHETTKIKPQSLVEDALQTLRATYPTVKARHLFHNRQEITVLLQKSVDETD